MSYTIPLWPLFKSWKKYESHPKCFIHELFLSISSAFTYNSLWLSCSIRVKHIKDGDHTSCLCSISRGSESSILTGREEALANSVLLYLLLCLPFSPCFCIRGACYRSTAAYCGRGGNINESTLCQVEMTNQ